MIHVIKHDIVCQLSQSHSPSGFAGFVSFTKEINMTTAKEYIQSTFETVKARNGHEAEFLQAVEEFLSTFGTCF